MMVIYNPATGEVSQAIFSGDFEALEAVYKANGYDPLVGDYSGNPAMAYVKDGVITERPMVQVGGTIRNIKADGQDALELTVSPASFTVSIGLNGDVIHQESDTTGSFSFSTDQPGTYTIVVQAAFPYFQNVFTVTAS